MKVIDILNNEKRGISMEVFPPKKPENFEKVKNSIVEIARLKPAFMSVTYGAGGGTSEFTLAIAEALNSIENVPTIAHLTCVSSTKATVKHRIEELKAHGIENIMALRGDLTPEMDISMAHTWDYSYATDLIAELVPYGFCLGGGCYPEVHPEAPDAETDLKNLKLKVDMGCNFLTSQMFFDNDIFLNFIDKAQKIGIDVPILPGIMPVTTMNQVERSIKMSGTKVPAKFVKMVEKYGSNPDDFKKAGIDYAIEQIIDLYERGVKHAHVYSMNNPFVAESIMDGVKSYL